MLTRVYKLLTYYPVIKPGIHSGKGVKIFKIDFNDINDAIEYVSYYIQRGEICCFRRIS